MNTLDKIKKNNLGSDFNKNQTNNAIGEKYKEEVSEHIGDVLNGDTVLKTGELDLENFKDIGIYKKIVIKDNIYEALFSGILGRFHKKGKVINILIGSSELNIYLDKEEKINNIHLINNNKFTLNGIKGIISENVWQV